MSSITNHTRRLDAIELDDRVRQAVQLVERTPGMHIGIHRVDERVLIDWARRHGNRYVRVIAGNDPAGSDAFATVTVTLDQRVQLYAAHGGPFARRRVKDHQDEASIARRDAQDLAA